MPFGYVCVSYSFLVNSLASQVQSIGAQRSAERCSETRSAAGALLIKLRRSPTRSGAPRMAGALPGAQRSDRAPIDIKY